jgi:hypothetical protein
MAWITIIGSLAACGRFSEGTQMLQLFSVVQAYTVIAFALVVLSQGEEFGSNPECNQNAVAVIFRPFSALHAGRIFGWIVVTLMFAAYTTMTVRDYTARVRRWRKTHGTGKTNSESNIQPTDSTRDPFSIALNAPEANNFVAVEVRISGKCSKKYHSID